MERNQPGSLHVEYAVRDGKSGHVQWDGNWRRPLPDDVGCREIVSWQIEQDPQDCDAIILWIDV